MRLLLGSPPPAHTVSMTDLGLQASDALPSTRKRLYHELWDGPQQAVKSTNVHQICPRRHAVLCCQKRVGHVLRRSLNGADWQVHASGLFPLIGAKLCQLCSARGWDAAGAAARDDLNVACHIVTFHATAAPGACLALVVKPEADRSLVMDPCQP